MPGEPVGCAGEVVALQTGMAENEALREGYKLVLCALHSLGKVTS